MSFVVLPLVFTNDSTPRSKYPKGTAGYKKNASSNIGASIGVIRLQLFVANVIEGLP